MSTLIKVIITSILSHFILFDKPPLDPSNSDKNVVIIKSNYIAEQFDKGVVTIDLSIEYSPISTSNNCCNWKDLICL